VLLDYSVFDAIRGGFERVVFIIRKDLESDFREIVLARLEGKVKFEFPELIAQRRVDAKEYREFHHVKNAKEYRKLSSRKDSMI
jgi:hypothetical protein